MTVHLLCFLLSCVWPNYVQYGQCELHIFCAVRSEQKSSLACRRCKLFSMRLYYSPFSPCWLLLTDLKICTSLIEQRPDFPIGLPLDRIDFLICSKTRDRSLCISLRLMMQIIAVEFRSEIKSGWSCVVTRLGTKSDRIWNMLLKV